MTTTRLGIIKSSISGSPLESTSQGVQSLNQYGMTKPGTLEFESAGARMWRSSSSSTFQVAEVVR